MLKRQSSSQRMVKCRHRVLLYTPRLSALGHAPSGRSLLPPVFAAVLNRKHPDARSQARASHHDRPRRLVGQNAAALLLMPMQSGQPKPEPSHCIGTSIKFFPAPRETYRRLCCQFNAPSEPVPDLRSPPHALRWRACLTSEQRGPGWGRRCAAGG